MMGQVQPSVERDPLIAALARYVEALHRRYPDGPDQSAVTLGSGASGEGSDTGGS